MSHMQHKWTRHLCSVTMKSSPKASIISNNHHFILFSREKSWSPVWQSEKRGEWLCEEGPIPGCSGKVHRMPYAKARRVCYLHQQVGGAFSPGSLCEATCDKFIPLGCRIKTKWLITPGCHLSGTTLSFVANPSLSSNGCRHWWWCDDRLGLASGYSCRLRRTQPPSYHVTQDTDRAGVVLAADVFTLFSPAISHLPFSFTIAAGLLITSKLWIWHDYSSTVCSRLHDILTGALMLRQILKKQEKNSRSF